MKTAVGYVLAGILALFGAGALLAANSLWMPATNPFSPAASDFRRDMVVANLAGLVAFTLAGESLFHLSRKPAVARVLWAIVGTLLCAAGTILLVNLRPAPEAAMESTRQALRFQAGVGLAYVLLGASALWMRARRR